MRMCLLLPLASLLILGAAWSALGMETDTVHLASELDVGRDMLKGCSSVLFEAGALCNGVKPFGLHPQPSSACGSYFWCAPGRGACLLRCPQGQVFNAGSSSCQERTATFDLYTCTSSSSSSTQRKLLAADISDAQPSAAQIMQETHSASTTATTTAAAADDSTVIYHAASGAVTDSNGSQLPPPQRKPTSPAFGSWNQHGKYYSMGQFAGSNIVKEPAMGPTRTPTPSSSSSSSAPGNKITNEIGSRLRASTGPRLPVSAEDDSFSGRALLATEPSTAQHTAALLATEPSTAQHTAALLATEPSTAQHTAARLLSMKRMAPKTVESGAAASIAAAATAAADASTAAVAIASVQEAESIDAKKRSRQVHPASTAHHRLAPSAARALGPEDESDVPFATHAATRSMAPRQRHTVAALKQHSRRQPARAVRMTDPSASSGITGSSSSSTGSSSSTPLSISTPLSSSTTTGSPTTATPGSTSSSDASRGSDSGDIVDIGQLTGPEADAAKREFAMAPPVHVHPHIVPLPDYMQGPDAPYTYEPRGYHPRGHGRRESPHGRDHDHKDNKEREYEETRGYHPRSDRYEPRDSYEPRDGPYRGGRSHHGSRHAEGRRYGPHSSEYRRGHHDEDEEARSRQQ